MSKSPQKATATQKKATPSAKKRRARAFSFYGLQPQVLVGPANDRYEQEADTMANRVVNMPQPQGPHPSAAQVSPLNRPVQRQPKTAIDSQVQTKRTGPATAPANLGSRLAATKGQGITLSPEVRGYMEPRFEADFSQVRIHQGSEAVQLNRQLQAKAFTHGSDIYFNEGYYQPQQQEGRRLLAHELTHTIQQGASVRRSPISRLSGPRIQRFLGKLLLRGISALAQAIIPGYSLLNVIRGKDLLTGDPVARTGINLIRGFVQLVPVVGTLLFAQMKQTGTLPAAGKWVEKQVQRIGLNFDQMNADISRAWDEMSIWKGIEGNVRIFKKYVWPHILKLKRVSGLIWQKIKELIFEVLILRLGGRAVLRQLKTSPGAFSRLVNNPLLIINWMLKAVRMGFAQFRANFGNHFKNAVIQWLFGNLAASGIQLPEKFDLKGLFHLVAQLFGLTYPQIKQATIKRLGPKGETMFGYLETAVGWVQRLIVQGPLGLWTQVQEQLANLPSLILPPIIRYVTLTIIKQATARILMMLNPAGAIIQAVLMIYKTVMFFIENWQRITAIVNGIFTAIRWVAFGKVKAAAQYIESVMARGLGLLITFLAKLIGLGGIGKKVREILLKIGKPIYRLRDRLIGSLVRRGKRWLQGKSTRKKTSTKEPKQDTKVSTKDAARHQAYVRQIKNKLERPLPRTPSRMGTLYRFRQRQIRQLVRQYQPKLKRPITLKITPTPLAQARRTKAIGYRIRIAPNDATGQARSTFRPEPSKVILSAPQAFRYLAYPSQQKAIAMVGRRAKAILNPAHPPKKGTATSGNADGPVGALIAQGKAGQGHKNWIRGHLINHDLGGRSIPGNLFPLTSSANAQHYRQVERHVKHWVATDRKANRMVEYEVLARKTQPASYQSANGYFIAKVKLMEDDKPARSMAVKINSIADRTLSPEGKTQRLVTRGPNLTPEVLNQTPRNVKANPAWHHGKRKESIPHEEVKPKEWTRKSNQEKKHYLEKLR